MTRIRNLFVIFVSLEIINAIKVNMQGSLSLGSEVMQAVSWYLGDNIKGLSGRRSLGDNSDPIERIIKSSFLCRDLKFCSDDLGKFVYDHLYVLTKAIEGVVNDEVVDRNQARLAFGDELKNCLKSVKRILDKADSKVTPENKSFIWLDVLKRISAKFQEVSINFAVKGVVSINDSNKKLIQKLVGAIAFVELKFIAKLCSYHEICEESTLISKNLEIFLNEFEEMTDEQVREFMKYFHKAIPDTPLYSKLSETTGLALQEAFNDMAYSNHIPTKKVILTFRNAVKSRNEAVRNNTVVAGQDVQLVHTILSDMDHFYGKKVKRDYFGDFLARTRNWKKGAVKGVKFRAGINEIVSDVSDHLDSFSQTLLLKMIYETRVFLELTIEP